MKKLFTTLLLVLFAFQIINAQKKSDWGIQFHGFVKTDYMIDTRQTVTAREGHFLLFPAQEVFDHEGEDINAVPNFNALSIQTRLKGVISGPDAFGAKTSGVIEGAFFGHSNADINGFRLRHAFVKLSWTNSSLLLGQYWHPMFITDCFPGTISFNTGVPFQPFSRNPQIRFTQKMSSVYLSLVAASQRDFASSGPNPADPSKSLVSSKYLRDALIPILHADLMYKADNFLIGAGVNYKSLKPALSVNGTEGRIFQQDETISAVSAMAYAKFKSGAFTWKVEGIMANNLYDNLMLGGYAVKSINEPTGRQEYTPIGNISFWTDLSYGKDLVWGIFVGYTQNQGADDKVVGSVWARGTNIDNVLRVSPRVQYTMGKTRFAAEIEYTSAAYGTADENLKVTNTTSVANTRVLLAAYYLF